jgi:hypothetical protein
MGPDRTQALLQAGYWSFIPILAAVLMAVLGRLAANGKLARNSFVGIRTPSTTKSDQAWIAGHRAALRTVPLFVFAAVALTAALFAAALWASIKVVILLGFVSFGVVLALLIWAAIVASKAAKAADEHGEGRPA